MTNDDRLSAKDFANFLAMLTATFSINYADKDSIDYAKAQLVYRMCKVDHWGSKEFRRHVNRFIKRQKYPTWSPADFFDEERSVLYPETWMKAEVAKNPNAKRDMQGYEFRANGTACTLWRYYSPTRIGLKQIWPPEKIPKMRVLAPEEALKAYGEGINTPEPEKSHHDAKKQFLKNHKIRLLTERGKQLMDENNILKKQVTDLTVLLGQYMEEKKKCRKR